ncbi:MAG: glycosyltransferase [Acidimicrobiia bacterium]
MATTELLSIGPRDRSTAVVDVDIVIPVYNEEAALEASVLRLHRYLHSRFPLTWTITVADNASRDGTWPIACRLADSLDGVRAVHLDQKGRGRALKAVWLQSEANVVAYMDVDLSTDLDALLPLVAPLLSGHSDVAIGSRLAPGARVVRGPKREVISRTYNLMLRATLHNGFSDAQCGFKAMRADVAHALVPMIEDNGWFFDTEMLVLAEHNVLRIHEVPVDWVDDPDSRVDVVSTARDDIKGIWRMWRMFAHGDGVIPTGALVPDTAGTRPSLTGQVVRFAGIGVVSTLVFAVLFTMLARPLGVIGADLVALAISAAGNIAANRRITFATRGRPGRVRHYGTGLLMTAMPLVFTVSALVLIGTATASFTAALVAVTVANLVATAFRFVLLRTWVFKP